jgi:hypothetical protein
MKSLTESPAILTVHQGSPGQFVIRGLRQYVVAATKLLAAEGAQSFIVVTETDVKVFDVQDADAVTGNGNGAADTDTEATSGDADTLPPADGDDPFDAAADAAIAAAAEVVGETPQGTKVVRRKRNQSNAGHDSPCQRCSGTGKVAVAFDNGSSSEAACPICKGAGVMRRYGSR